MPHAQRAEIAKLEALHAEHPQGRIFTHLAEAYRKAGELERAREVLSEGIGRHPDYSSAHVVLARVLADQGDEDAATAEFRRVLELDSQNLVALRSLGDLARRAGRTEEAADYYRRLLDVEPSDGDVRNLLAEIEGGAAPRRDAAPATDDLSGADESAEPWAAGLVEPEPAGAPEPADAPEPLEQPEPEPEPEALEPWVAPGVEEEPEAEPLSTYDLDGEDFDAPGAAAPDADEGVPWISGDEPVEPAAEADDLPGGEWAETADEIEDEEPAELPGLPELPELPPEPADPELATETIAQVYARQGLYDRAADVYRQLLRGRPDDAALRTRLEEMEALAAAPAPDDVAPLPGLETSEFSGADDVEPLPGLETDELDPSTGLRGFEGEPPAVEHLPEGTVRDVPAPPEEETPSPEPWSPASLLEEEPEPWAAGAEAGSEEQDAPAAEQVESYWTGAEGASGGEESPYAWAEEEGPADDSEPIGRYFESLLTWTGGARPEPADAGGDEDEGGEEGAAPSSPQPDADDDDDLDTFRSWLESLKQ